MSREAIPAGEPQRLPRLRARLRELYFGHTSWAVRFRTTAIVIDLVLIAFFIAAPMMRGSKAYLVIDYVLALVLAVELAARALAWSSLKDWIRRPIVWVDIFVLLTLLAPTWLFNLAFLRVLRLWTLTHSDYFWTAFGRRFDRTRWEEVTRAHVAMITFVFIATGFVYSSFAGRIEGISSYIDALYFTVTTLTTTGFGDVTLPGAWGKLISIGIMIAGITLFVRLAQVLFRPNKVQFRCPACGLMRHDLDAVHCKACGTLLNIPNDEL